MDLRIVQLAVSLRTTAYNLHSAAFDVLSSIKNIQQMTTYGLTAYVHTLTTCEYIVSSPETLFVLRLRLSTLTISSRLFSLSVPMEALNAFRFRLHCTKSLETSSSPLTLSRIVTKMKYTHDHITHLQNVVELLLENDVNFFRFSLSIFTLEEIHRKQSRFARADDLFLFLI